MEIDERRPLLNVSSSSNGLSVFFAIICVIDVFGVFPIVTLPKAVIDCGYYGILLVVIVCSVQIYTASLLGKCWNIAEKIDPNVKNKCRHPYSALAEITYGKCTARFVSCLVDLSVFSGGVPNLIVASQNLELLGVRVSSQNVNISFCYWILILGVILCPMLWFGSPKDMKIICSISVIIVVSVFILTCTCILLDLPQRPADSSSPNIVSEDVEHWKRIMTAYGIIAFQFDVHPVILTIQMDMKDKSKLSIAVIGGFLVSVSMFAVVTILSVIKHGVETTPSILETLPTSIPLHITAVLVAVQLCLTSVVSNNALYQDMENCFNISREFNIKRCILRTMLTLLAILLAEAVPRFDLVMSLIGGTFTSPLIFILPPLFYLKITKLYEYNSNRIQNEPPTLLNRTKPDSTQEMSEEYTYNLAKYYETKFREEFRSYANRCEVIYEWMYSRKLETIACIFIILAAVFCTSLSTYLNVENSALSYTNFTKPCIYKIFIHFLDL